MPDRARYSLAGRTHVDVARFFEGLELVDPGLVPIDRWRPEDLARSARPRASAWHDGAIVREP